MNSGLADLESRHVNVPGLAPISVGQTACNHATARASAVDQEPDCLHLSNHSDYHCFREQGLRNARVWRGHSQLQHLCRLLGLLDRFMWYRFLGNVWKCSDPEEC